MDWSPAALAVLRSRLAPRYPTQEEREAWLGDVGFTRMEVLSIRAHPAPLYAWYNILEWANPRGRVDAIVAALRAESPGDTEVQTLSPALPEPAASPPELNGWKGRAGLERVLGNSSTLVGVSWLAAGIGLARAVGRVNVGSGGYGTGFLVQGVGGDLLLTNHHVLPTREVAEASTVSFNYEEDLDGAPLVPDTRALDVARFATSPTRAGDDWTAVGVAPRMGPGGPQLASASWGAVPLAATSAEVGSRVNIVQHPGGLPKRIATVSNLVAWAGDGRVQYLTDTEPGSSGSPVFDARWRIVAIHHAGGAPVRADARVLCNEGIAIGTVIDGLRAAGLIAQ